METARWTRIEELLQAALDLDAPARAAFLTEACGSDAELRGEVEALLAREREHSVLSAFARSAAAIAPAVSLTGRTIGHYSVGARIGSGGMGEVYEARDERLQRIVALKTLPTELMDDEDRVQRFEREALTVSRLNHPNIITIFEIIRDGDAHFIATERVDGQTLRRMLIDPETGDRRPMPDEQALDIVVQIAAALKAAHTAWIIHRDIKPENIMVRADGLVKVLDFGIAKLNDDPSDGERIGDPAPSATRAEGLTVPGAILGTANYMSPEQARGEPLDGRTDLFSLGQVFHEMLTGTRDIDGKATDRLPGELQRIVRKLLRTDRRDRYPSAAELLDDLHRLKRRMSSRTARRMAGLSAIAVAAAVAIAAIAALLSIDESWEERILRDGHGAAVRQVVFSPDGRLLVSCGEDGQVIVWDFARRQRLATLDGPRAHKAAFSPDGRWLATGGVDGNITVWDANRGARLRVLRGHPREISALASSPDGTLLASGSRDGSTAFWSTRDWRKTAAWPAGGEHGTFLFSHDTRHIALTGPWTVFDRETGRSSLQPELSANWGAVSPDGEQLATIDSLGNVAFHSLGRSSDLSRPELIASQRAHQDHGRAIAFSPDGRLVASAAEGVLLWDAASRRKIARFDHNAIVWSVAFSPDGRWLVSSHGDGALLVWDVAERELVSNLSEHSGAVRSVTFSPDGRRAASGSEDRSVTVWNTETGQKEAVLAGHSTRVTSVAFTRDGTRLASGDQDGVIISWDPGDRRSHWRWAPIAWAASYAIDVSPDGRRLVTSNGLHTTGDGALLTAFRSRDWPFGSTYGAAFSPDGRRLACVTDGGWVILLDGMSGRVLEKRRVPDTNQISVDLSPDGKWLVTGEDQGAVRLWSVEPLRQTAILGRHSARVKSVAFAPDGETVASAGDDKMIALWDVARRKLRARIGTHASPIYSIAFSPDGRRLISGEHDRSVRIYTRRRSLWDIRLD